MCVSQIAVRSPKSITMPVFGPPSMIGPATLTSMRYVCPCSFLHLPSWTRSCCGASELQLFPTVKPVVLAITLPLLDPGQDVLALRPEVTTVLRHGLPAPQRFVDWFRLAVAGWYRVRWIPAAHASDC